MPIYEYSCRKCGRDFEELVFDDTPPTCPHCGSNDTHKLMRNKEPIDAAVLEEAYAARIYRANLVEEIYMEEYDREMIKVRTSGQAVGQVNGLSVTWHGDFEFGLPHRISCTVGVGHEGIIDLEREAELGGPIHTKAMAKKDSEYQQALAEPYTSAQPVSTSSSSKTPATKRKKPAAQQSAARSTDESNVATQAAEWKSSREDLENTRHDVNARISSYDETVNNLLG